MALALADEETAKKEPAAAPEGAPYQYAVKFICGQGDGEVVARGRYFTAINVHNPSNDAAGFRKKFAIALPQETPGPVTEFFDTGLGPDQAFEIDNADIFRHTRSNTPFLKGFVIIHSKVELNVVAVYTVAGQEGQVVSLDVERVSPRRINRGAEPRSPVPAPQP
jgi:hypothetical protein